MLDSSRHIRNLALVGFMGTGKTSVGRLAAAALRFEFVDTDEMIESRAGLRISEIFARHGEAHFRALESEAVKELESRQKVVISTGGGCIVAPENLASLRSHCLIICLWASPAAIHHRVRNQSHRPLLQGPDPLAKNTALLHEREPAYRQADLLLNSELRSLRELSHHIAHHYRAAVRESAK